MKIEEMEAGPELNALMAEVMGWTLDPEGCWLDRAEGYADTGWGDLDNTYHLPVWSPSTNIAAAWQVVEKLYSAGWTVNVGSLAAHPRGWRCTLTQMHADDFYKHPQTWEANADTVCLAICRAALLAVGVEEV